MPKRIRFALIGASSIAAGHIDAIRINPKAELVYIYSRDIKRAGELSKQFGLKPAGSYEEILKDETIDAVDIITEPSRHVELALEAIKNDKHVIIEKPLDTDLSKAEHLLDAASNSKKVISVISQKRFDPKIKRMKKALDAGSIGRPLVAEASLFWRRTKEYYESGNGWRSREGDVLFNQAIHWLDIALWFFGIPKRVNAFSSKIKKEIDCDDTAVCSLEFADGVLFNLSCSTALDCSLPDKFRIYATKGVLDYNSAGNRQLSRISSFVNKAVWFIKPSKTLHYYQIEDFVDAIINNRPPAVSLRDAYNVLKVVKSCA